MGLLDLIFPKYCVNCKKYGDFLCISCFSRLSFDVNKICLVCGNPSYDGLTHPKCRGKYSAEGEFTGVVFNYISKKLIYQFKYKPYLFGLRDYLVDLLYESLIQNEEFNKISSLPLVMIPIPLSPQKLKKRGYNQAEILAKGLSKKFGFPVVDYLIRIKDTPSQVGLNKKERRENINGAFAVKPKFENQIKNKNIIIVDDVLTSGATISEAVKVLKKAGAGRIWGLAFAKEN